MVLADKATIRGITYNNASRRLRRAGDHTVYIISYAEVLLTYAEAKAMSGGTDATAYNAINMDISGYDVVSFSIHATAYNAINMVRKRAGLADLVPGLSPAAFRDSVIAERGWEFADLEPAARWFDLLRTETVGKVNLARNAGEDPLKNLPSDALHSFYWAPIPINDQQLNPNLH